MGLVRRLGGILLLGLLATPASLSLPSARVATGAVCAMACDHGTGMACCCASGSSASFRRCPVPGDGLLQTQAMRVVVPDLPGSLGTLPMAGLLALLTGGVFFRLFSERPDPVPKLLS